MNELQDKIIWIFCYKLEVNKIYIFSPPPKKKFYVLWQTGVSVKPVTQKLALQLAVHKFNKQSGKNFVRIK